MATDQATENPIIKKTPNVCGGDACIGNRRIPVWQVVESRQLGMSDREIMNMFATPLTPAELEAAWEYDAQNRSEIDEAIRLNDECMYEDDVS